MKGKITLVVLILLVMSYVPVIPDVTSQISPNIYYLTTPTIVNGTSILDLSNGIYYIEESITLADDATLTIRDATLYFTSDSRTIIIANDNSQITIERSQISHESGYSYINIHDMSHLTLSTSILLDVYTRYYDSSRGVISDSVTTSDVRLYDSSYMSMQNASIPSFYLYDLSNASITQSIIYNFLYLEFEADIQVTLNTISVGQIEYLNLFKLNVSDTLINSWRIVVSGTSEVTLTNSNIEYLYAYSQSKLNIDDSTLRYLYVFDYSDVSLTDSNVTGAVYLEFEQDSDLDLTGLRPGTIDSWNLVESGSVSNSDIDLVIQNSDVSSWHVYVRGDSVVSFSDSELGYVYAYDDSVVSVFSSTVYGVYGYSESNVMIALSEIQNIGVYDFSNLTINDSVIQYTFSLELDYDSKINGSLPTGTITSWNIFQDMTILRAYVNCTINNSTINNWTITVTGTSEVTLTNSNIEYLYAYSQSKLNIDDSTLRYLYVFDYSDVSLTDSNVTGAVYLEFEQDSDLDLTGLRPGTIDSWNLVESGSVSYCNLVIQNSDVSSWHVYVRGDSVVSFSDSELGYVYAYDDSVVSVFSSTVQGIYSYGFSGTTFMDSILDYMYVYDSAKLVIIDSTVRYGTTLEFEFDSKLNTALPIGSISQWNLESVTTNSRINLVITNSQLEGKWTIYGRHIADVAITNSQMDYVYTYDSSSILLMNSTIRTAYSYDVSRFTMTNSIMDNTLFSYESSIIQVFDSYVNKLRSYKTSSVVLYNCTSFEVTVYDSSKIKVGWYILITIRDADEGPINGIKVKISDATQVELYDLFTDSEGIVKTILWEKTIYTNDVIKYGNYTLRITNGDIVDEFIQIPIKNNVDTTYIYKRINPLSNLFGLPRYLGIILIMICVAAIIIIFLVSRNRSVTWS